MRDIPGTERTTFELILDEVFKKDDIITTSGGSNAYIDHRELYRPFTFKYTTSLKLEGEELEIAYNHFKFLNKHNLI